MHRLPRSKIDFDINNVKIGSKIYPADAHCITNSTSTIMIPTSDIYRLCQLLLKNKVCWMIIFILTTAVVVTTVAIHTHYHFNPSFKEQDKPIVSPARNLTWKKLLACGTSVRFTVRSQTTRSEKISRLYLLDWRLPPVMAESLHIINHLVLGVYNPLYSQNTSLV